MTTSFTNKAKDLMHTFNGEGEEEDLKYLLNADLSSTENIKKIGSFFKSRFTTISKSVVTNRMWLKSAKSKTCHVLITFVPGATLDSIYILLEMLLKEDLIVNVNYHKTTHVVAFYITASYERLLKGAEELELKKPIKQTYGGGIKEFIFEEQEFYENIEDEELFLTTQEKQKIIYDMINRIKCDTDLEPVKLNGVDVPNGRKIFYWSLKHKIISQILPIHDQEDLKNLRNKWVFSFLRKQPLDEICKYFGVKLTLYFAWLGFYARALVIPAFLGLAMWISRGKNDTHDSIFFVVLCFFNLIWSICFNDMWKQRCAEYAYKWGTLDIKDNLLQEPRPMFKGEYKPSKVTGKLEPHYPEYKRALFFYFITIPCLAFTIMFTVGIMILMFKIQVFFVYATENKFFPALFGLTNFLPKMIYADIITSLNSVYKRLCTWLNDHENYREKSTHENQLIVKIVAFQFINSYLSLFYIAFYLRDVQLLQAQLFAIFITRQLTGNIKESLLPYVFASMRQIKIINKSKRDSQTSEPNQELIQQLERLQAYASNFVKSRRQMTKKVDSSEEEVHVNVVGGDQESINQPELESIMPCFDDTFDDYLEMVMQFGLMVFFAPAFPLAALFSLINNIIEIRSDAFKMCLLFQRPFGQRVSNIGTWQNVLEVFSTLGIVVNCALFITFDIIPKLWPGVTFYESIAAVVVIEHVFLAFRKFLSYAIPDQPRWIIIEKCKLEHRRREALKQLEINQIHSLKSKLNQ